MHGIIIVERAAFHVIGQLGAIAPAEAAAARTAITLIFQIIFGSSTLCLRKTARAILAKMRGALWALLVALLCILLLAAPSAAADESDGAAVPSSPAEVDDSLDEDLPVDDEDDDIDVGGAPPPPVEPDEMSDEKKELVSRGLLAT